MEMEVMMCVIYVCSSYVIPVSLKTIHKFLISSLKLRTMFCFVLSYVYLVTFLYRVCYYHYSRN